MSRPGRKLSPQEAELWARVARTVAPLQGREAPRAPDEAVAKSGEGASPPMARPAVLGKPVPAKPVVAKAFRHTPLRPSPSHPGGADIGLGLDSSWDRKLTRGTVEPDFTLDLHGASLDAAHGRLMHGLTQAKAMRARVVLLVTGKPRPAEAADRANRRGAIRAKVIDWLAHSEHAADIAAVRNAHRRHGGHGALYIILKRRRA